MHILLNNFSLSSMTTKLILHMLIKIQSVFKFLKMKNKNSFKHVKLIKSVARNSQCLKGQNGIFMMIHIFERISVNTKSNIYGLNTAYLNLWFKIITVI